MADVKLPKFDASIPLNEELRPYLSKMEGSLNGWMMLQHPLVYQVPYFPELADHANEMYAVKKKALEGAQEQQNWFRYVFLHERPYRLDAMRAIDHLIEDPKQYWTLLGNIYTDTENLWQKKRDWRALLTDSRGDREFIMEEDDRKTFEELPAYFDIYRGYTEHGTQVGFSWSRNEGVAHWFAKRLRRPGERATVIKARIAKRDVFGTFDGRNEADILTLPESPTGVKIIARYDRKEV